MGAAAPTPPLGGSAAPHTPQIGMGKVKLCTEVAGNTVTATSRVSAPKTTGHPNPKAASGRTLTGGCAAEYMGKGWSVMVGHGRSPTGTTFNGQTKKIKVVPYNKYVRVPAQKMTGESKIAKKN